MQTRRDGNRIINFIKPDVQYMLKEQRIGLDLGCCSIKFDQPDPAPGG
ncbi:MAG: hypothetical protein ACE5ER_09715 [Nitrospinaceae bacterium]